MTMDDEDFGDDDLDAIPDNTLLELEQHAFSSTQRPKSNAGPVQQKGRIQTYGSTGLTRNGNVNRTTWKPFKAPRPSQPATGLSKAPPPSAPDPPSQDFGLNSDDVIIDQDDPSLVINQTSALPSKTRSATPAQNVVRNGRYGSKAPADDEALAAFARADAELAEIQIGGHGSGQWAHAPHLNPAANGLDVSSLQARIAELEADQARLRHSEQEARNAAQAKTGEIAIVRANQEKTMKEYERRIAVMQKLHSDEAARQKAELEAGKKERERMETDNRFLKHDLAQESERTRRLNGPGKARVEKQETPRKTKRAGLGDGFDDDEVVLVSPSKSKDKSREQTPKVGAKRKRPAQDSPIAPLSFDQPPKKDNSEQLRTAMEHQQRAMEAKEKSRFSFMQKVLNHCPYEGHERTVEALTKHHFPSDTRMSLSSMFMQDFTSNSKEEYLPLKLGRSMLKLWSRCLEEKHYPPIYLLLDMLRFAIRLELSDTISQIIEDAVPLCNRTIRLVAVPTFKASMYPLYAASPDFQEVQSDVAPHIDVDEVLDFVRELCDAASLSSNHIELFWQKADFESTLLMLNKAQPVSQITAALQILGSSALSTTFGPICENAEDAAEKQAKQEKDIVERLTSLLFEMPVAPKDEPVYTDQEIMELRIEILNLLRDLCLKDHGGLLLAQHRSTMGRLIRFLDGQVSKLYTTRPSLGLVASDQPPLHGLIVQTINTTARIIYHLLRTYDAHIDFLQKLRVIKGGYHKFLVSMTRIAFSDRLVFEEGLDEEVVEAAHQILDSVLSPEEGEAVVKAVETPRGTKGTTTERDSQATDPDETMEEDPG